MSLVVANATAPESLSGRKGSALVGVLTVIDEEFEQVAPVLGTTENILGTHYYGLPGTKDHHQVVLAQLSGRGNVKAADAAGKLIEDFRPAYIILVGVAGGVKGRDGVGIADVIVPNFIDYYEIRKLEKGRSLRRVEPHDHPAHSLLHSFAIPISRKKDWVGRVNPSLRPKDAGPNDGVPPQFRMGYLITGEKVLSDDTAEVQRYLLNEYDKAIAVDMESFGVAQAVYSNRGTRHYNPQFLVVRGVSDLIRHLKEDELPEGEALGEKTNNEVRQEWKPYAAHAAAIFTQALIEQLLRSCGLPAPIVGGSSASPKVQQQ
ncbi:hypothetical protein ACQR09_29065 [Bradyrhizobium oligotrophicum]|uniref:5'-methylthioadenosine/S-adenosylhomocysteine nucleosidase family protein n=1 Tax=Bradyrhizobium oligotrophicum TaxID=44255 RepID=UPI003EB925DE